jgi:hypothetical protein
LRDIRRIGLFAGLFFSRFSKTYARTTAVLIDALDASIACGETAGSRSPAEATDPKSNGQRKLESLQKSGAYITDNVDAVAASLAWAAPTQPSFNGCVEFGVGRRHFRCDFAVLDEGQNALEPSEVLHGRASLGALRGGALSSSRYRALGEFGL